MELGNDVGKFIDQCHIKLPVVSEVAQQFCLIEASHLHGKLEHVRHGQSVRAAAGLCRLTSPQRLSTGIDDQIRLLRSPADRGQAQIKLRSKASVKFQFFAAEVLASLKRREIEKVELDGLLDLPREVVGQQHPGNMRLNQLNAASDADERRPRGRLFQRFDESFGIIESGWARHW